MSYQQVLLQSSQRIFTAWSKRQLLWESIWKETERYALLILSVSFVYGSVHVPGSTSEGFVLVCFFITKWKCWPRFHTCPTYLDMWVTLTLVEPGLVVNLVEICSVNMAFDHLVFSIMVTVISFQCWSGILFGFCLFHLTMLSRVLSVMIIWQAYIWIVLIDSIRSETDFKPNSKQLLSIHTWN